MTNYYCLVTGLPELSLEDGKLSYTVANFKTEIYPELSKSDKKLVDLFYLKYDNQNLLALLTDKEAVVNTSLGNFSADELLGVIASFKEEAAKILEEARKEADAIVAAARKSAAETAENTQSEIKLFAGQAVNALKTEITSLLTNQVVSKAVKDFVADKDYLNKFIVSLATQWVADEAIVISTSDAEGLKKFFAANAKAVLDKGVKIEQVNGNKALFTISPADGSYKVNFGEEEFENYFKDFLRPQLVEMLF